ncbi:MAG: hypothetical protein AAF224_03375 [Pseudomonadota bacterium]
MRRIDDLELAIAATRAEDFYDLFVKFERLIEALGFDLTAPPNLQTVLIKAIRDDLRHLVDDETASVMRGRADF